MNNERTNTIEAIIARLHHSAHTEQNTDLFEVEASCIEELVKLPEEFTPAIIHVARKMLEEQTTSDDDYRGYYFILLVYALLDRKEKEVVFTLLSQALHMPQAEDKYRYVKILEEIDLDSTIPVFIDVLPKIKSFDEYGGHAQEEIIEYLMQKNIAEAYPAVIQCLFDEADRVRATVLQFIKKYNKKEASLSLIKLLEKEDIQYNILLILDLLSQWKTVEAIPLLKQQIKEDWVYDDDELLLPYRQAITTISE